MPEFDPVAYLIGIADYEDLRTEDSKRIRQIATQLSELEDQHTAGFNAGQVFGTEELTQKLSWRFYETI